MSEDEEEEEEEEEEEDEEEEEEKKDLRRKSAFRWNSGLRNVYAPLARALARPPFF